MEISALLQKDNILVQMKVKDQQEAFSALAQRLFTSGCVSDVEGYMQALKAREEEFSTNIGFGIAIPHAKASFVKQAAIAVGSCESPISYGNSEEKVKMLFMLAVPVEHNNLHLEILKQLSKKIMDSDFREKILAAGSVEEIWQTLKDI